MLRSRKFWKGRIVYLRLRNPGSDMLFFIYSDFVSDTCVHEERSLYSSAFSATVRAWSSFMRRLWSHSLNRRLRLIKNRADCVNQMSRMMSFAIKSEQHLEHERRKGGKGGGSASLNPAYCPHNASAEKCFS